MELGLDGTVREVEAGGEVPDNEQAGNGLEPHSPSFPTKLRTPNFLSSPSGKRPYSSLFVRLSSFRLLSDAERSGTSPESRLL